LYHLAKLALVACVHVPLDIGFKSWPPKVVEQGALHRVEALVAKAVVGVVYQCVMSMRRDIELVTAAGLSLPKPAAHEKEAAHAANETCERIAMQVRRSVPRDEVLLNSYDVFVCFVGLVAARELDRLRVVVCRHVRC
jgi:hypothetical protein